jgi:hypothetical protein
MLWFDDSVVDSPHDAVWNNAATPTGPEGESSSLVGNRGEEESLLVAEGRRTNLFNSPKCNSATLGVLQLHIHVIPDLKGLGHSAVSSQYNRSESCVSVPYK